VAVTAAMAETESWRLGFDKPVTHSLTQSEQKHTTHPLEVHALAASEPSHSQQSNQSNSLILGQT